MTWEYAVLTWGHELASVNLNRMQEMGAQGWELVAVTVRPLAEVTCWFKREAQPR